MRASKNSLRPPVLSRTSHCGTPRAERTSSSSSFADLIPKCLIWPLAKPIAGHTAVGGALSPARFDHQLPPAGLKRQQPPTHRRAPDLEAMPFLLADETPAPARLARPRACEVSNSHSIPVSAPGRSTRAAAGFDQIAAPLGARPPLGCRQNL